MTQIKLPPLSLPPYLPPSIIQAAIAEELSLRSTATKTKTTQTIAPKIDYRFAGGALTLQSATDQEIILAGPSETGKTIAALQLAHTLALTYPGARGAIMRKTRESMTGTVLETFTGKIITAGAGVKSFGGEIPKWFQYDNGSRIYVGGIDKPSRALSSERDFICVNQTEELTEDEWETLLTRCTGRAGHMPYGILFGDCNPAGGNHWIKLRARDGNLRLLESRHEDNPRLFNLDTGTITDSGKRTLAALDRLTGARKERLRFGKWVSPEGLVYSEFTDQNIVGGKDDEQRDFNPALPIEIAMDDGYIDPRVTLFIQKQDDHILIFDEMYHSRHLAQVCVTEIVERCGKWYGFDEIEDEETKTKIKQPKRLPDLAVIPPEAIELRQRLRLANIRARSDSSKITQGIEMVRRLIEDADKHRAILVHRRCSNLLRELTEGYKYPTQAVEQRRASTKRNSEDQPIDADNHGPDAFRYWAWMRARF